MCLLGDPGHQADTSALLITHRELGKIVVEFIPKLVPKRESFLDGL
jgi:hypothetical protein